MDNTSFRLQGELQRLINGPSPSEKPSGLGIVRFLVRCPFGTNDVLAQAKSVLKIVDEAALKGWPAERKSPPNLPKWFKSACVAKISSEQAKEWLVWWKDLPPEE
ncbi:MAG TPA: hypothetical protein VK737_09505 [Opitutales bacterium]|jgi:hypothetical protein|nr:hypothetical protein [Opitutales bacterium]